MNRSPKQLEKRLEELEKKNKKLKVNLKNQERLVDVLSEKYALSNNILLNTNDSVIEVDKNKVITFINKSCLKKTGYRQQEVLGKMKANELWQSRGKESHILEKCLKADREIKPTKCLLKNKQGDKKWFLVSAGPLVNVLGIVKGAFAIYTDIDLIEKSKEEIKKKNKELKKLDELKSQFVANVSHEFKSPLSIIKESLTIILDGLAGKITPEQERMLKAGKNNIERLVRLVMNILDVSKIESGKMKMEVAPVDIAKLVKEVLESYKDELLKRHLVLKYESRFSEEQITRQLLADRDKMIQVITNLLSNAIKYTPDNGIISVRVSGDREKVRLEISDTGPGIPKKHINKIFDKFERITAERQEGTGLGLPIAQDIVKLHKGKIWIESEIGKGSSFIVILPHDPKEKLDRASNSSKE